MILKIIKEDQQEASSEYKDNFKNSFVILKGLIHQSMLTMLNASSH